MVDHDRIRRSRYRMWLWQGRACWYCGARCWLPVRDQVLDGRQRHMATIEHQWDSRAEGWTPEVITYTEGRALVRRVMACRECNNDKGTWSGALNHHIRGTSEGDADVVQQASGEAS